MEDSNRKLELFEVIFYLNKKFDLDFVANGMHFESFKSGKECIDFLINEGYIIKNENLSESEISDKYTVSELKDILKGAGLKVSGKKQELVERVMPVLSGDGEDKLSSKAEDFLKENAWIDLYNFALSLFDFSAFNQYYEKSDEEIIPTALSFTDECIEVTYNNADLFGFLNSLSAKAHIYAYYGDYESFVDLDLQYFIFSLNPPFLDEQTYKRHSVINSVNITNLKNVLDKFDFGSLKKRFNKIWNLLAIKNITVPRKTSFKILEKALSGNDLSELNFDLRVKYFDSKFEDDN